MWGLTPVVRRKRSRKAVGDPKPTWAPMRSTECRVVSRRCWAWRMRARWSHWSGVTPVCSRKCRISVRVLNPA